MGGSTTLAESIVVTADTSGLSNEITIPTALASASAVFQGASLLTQGTMNLESQKGRVDRGKYENIQDSKKTGEGKNFTPAHKKRLLEANRNDNRGELRSDLSGKKNRFSDSIKKGVKANMNPSKYIIINTCNNNSSHAKQAQRLKIRCFSIKIDLF